MKYGKGNVNWKGRHRMMSLSLGERVALRQRSKGGKGVSNADVLVKSILGRKNSQCKGLDCSRKSKRSMCVLLFLTRKTGTKS
jgi:hypothetical protein